MISIVIPVYNGIEFLKECIDSVIIQTYTDWEVLIGVNGHGEDGGEVGKIANTMAALDARISVYIQPPPLKGKVESLHDLVTKAKGDWICILDCDDKWEPTKLEKQYSASLSVAKDAAVIGTFCHYFGERNGGPYLPTGYVHPSILEEYNPIINSSAMIKKQYCLWEYDDINYTMEDYSLWMDICLQGEKLYNIPEYLTWHRIHASSAFNTQGYSNMPLRMRYIQLRKTV
jgi:glycosyltransferase involved in cell wall biosynthesis